MKKIIIILSIVAIMCSFGFSQDNINMIDKSGYSVFLKENIGKNIVVNLSNIDVSLSGILLKVYDDGIILQTSFSTFFINKDSIAYIKVRNGEKTGEKE